MGKWKIGGMGWGHYGRGTKLRAHRPLGKRVESRKSGSVSGSGPGRGGFGVASFSSSLPTLDSWSLLESKCVFLEAGPDHSVHF